MSSSALLDLIREAQTRVVVKLRKHAGESDRGRYLTSHRFYGEDKRDDESSWAMVHTWDNDEVLWELENASSISNIVVYIKKYKNSNAQRYLATHAYYPKDKRDDGSGWAMAHDHKDQNCLWRIEVQDEERNVVRIRKHWHADNGRYLTAHSHHRGGTRDEHSSFALVHRFNNDDSLWELIDARVMVSISIRVEYRLLGYKRVARRSKRIESSKHMEEQISRFKASNSINTALHCIGNIGFKIVWEKNNLSSFSDSNYVEEEHDETVEFQNGKSQIFRDVTYTVTMNGNTKSTKEVEYVRSVLDQSAGSIDLGQMAKDYLLQAILSDVGQFEHGHLTTMPDIGMSIYEESRRLLPV